MSRVVDLMANLEASLANAKMEALRRHVDKVHEQGAVAYDVPDETITTWHESEHKPNGHGTHLRHAHDEVSARRHAVPVVAADG